MPLNRTIGWGRFTHPCQSTCDELLLVAAIGLALMAARAESSLLAWDFRAYLAASAALSEDRNPYIPGELQEAADSRQVDRYNGLPYLYQPLVARTLTPLLSLSTHAAALAWVGMKAFACALMAIGISRLADTRVSPAGAVLFALFVAGYRGVSDDFQAANVGVFEAFLLTVWLAGRHARLVWCPGVAMALATTIKPVPALLLVDEVHRRSWKAIGVCCLAVGLAVTLQLLDGSLALYWAYLRSSEFRLYWDQLQQGLFNHSLTSAIYRLTSETYLTQPLVPLPAFGPLLAPLAGLAVLGSIVFPLWRLEKRDGACPRSGPAAALLVTGLLLLSPRVAEYTMAWTVIPISLLAIEVFRHRDAIAGLLLLVGVACIQYHIKYSALLDAGWWQAWIDHHTYGVLFIHAACVRTCLRRAVRPQSPAP